MHYHSSWAQLGLFLSPVYVLALQQKSAPKLMMGKIISKPPTKWEPQKQPRGIPRLRLQTKGWDSGTHRYRASLIKSLL